MKINNPKIRLGGLLLTVAILLSVGGFSQASTYVRIEGYLVENNMEGHLVENNTNNNGFRGYQMSNNQQTYNSMYGMHGSTPTSRNKYQNTDCPNCSRWLPARVANRMTYRQTAPSTRQNAYVSGASAHCKSGQKPIFDDHHHQIGCLKY